MNSGFLLLPVIITAVGANVVLARKASDPGKRRFHYRVSAVGMVTFAVMLVVVVADIVEWLVRR